MLLLIRKQKRGIHRPIFRERFFSLAVFLLTKIRLMPLFASKMQYSSPMPPVQPVITVNIEEKLLRLSVKNVLLEQ